MRADKINIRLIDKDLEPVIISCPIGDLNNVEQIANYILDLKNVTPIYRLLFGLRLSARPSIWLAPSVKIIELLNLFDKPSDRLLDLRMRFRPASYTKLLTLDKNAFEIIFAQLRYDFIHTQFTDVKRNHVLLDDSVLGLIVTDLSRYALENKVNVEDIFEHIKPKDYMPRRAAKWQRNIPYLIKRKFDLEATARVFKNGDISKIKQAFIESFLLEVRKDYGSESYNVIDLENPNNPQALEIKVTYSQTSEESKCVVDARQIGKGLTIKTIDGWTELCNMDTLCYGTLRHEVVEINRTNGRPIKIKFHSSLEAKSFLSLIAGYYRLMRKWHFTFCRDISSPELEYLKRNKCHGPIGFENMRFKLSLAKKPGSFLIRKDSQSMSRYFIDVVLVRTRLVIDIEWNPAKKVFTKVGHEVVKSIPVSVLLNQEEYTDLKSLVNDMQIKLERGDSNNVPPLQLKNWIPPSEYDDCPLLLLSMSKKKYAEFDFELEKTKSLQDLPRFIPPSMLQFTTKLSQDRDNRMLVWLAVLNGEQDVIVKSHLSSGLAHTIVHNGSARMKNIVSFKVQRKITDQDKFLDNLDPSQLRVDWIFMKSSFFAETLGLEFIKNSLVQEHFPLGSLDKYLGKEVPEATKLSIACQLALALLFLQEKRVLHGKIRCHNIYLKNLDPIQIKIADPLGTFDADVDRAFLPPEYFHIINGQIYIQEYESGIDIWAVGTTLWQIYSKGCYPPPNRIATTLHQPSSCPDNIWQIIDSCWTIEPSNRATPQSLYRDINDSYSWQQETHNYDYIPQSADQIHQQENICLNNRSPTRNRSTCESRSQNSTSNGFESSTNGSGSQMNLLSSRNLNAIDVRMDAYRNPSINNLIQVCTKTSSLSFSRPVGRMLKGIRSLKDMSRNGIRKMHSNQDDSINMTQSSTTSSTFSISACSDGTYRSTILADTCDSSPDISSSIDPSKLKLGNEIGRGSCGLVTKGVLTNWGGVEKQLVAVKCVNSDAKDTSSLDDLRKEFEILRKLNHKNIVKTLGFVNEISFMLVVEYMPLGSLLAYIKNSHHDNLLNMPLSRYAQGIADGMQYLERERVVHRDLALRNILLKKMDEVKICDFGLAQHLGSSNHYKLKTDRALPLRWYAPETLQDWIFNHKTDVWSYGIVLWEIYSGGCNPQYSGTYADLLETLKHERLLRPKDCPEHVYNLMLSCWSQNPEDRDNFSQIYDRVQNFSDISYRSDQAFNRC